jgi:hypothetical protein
VKEAELDLPGVQLQDRLRPGRRAEKLTLGVDQERFTRLDRTLLDRAPGRRVDLHISPQQRYPVRVNRRRRDAMAQGLFDRLGARPVAMVERVDWPASGLLSVHPILPEPALPELP